VSKDGITLGDNDGKTEGFLDGTFDRIAVEDDDGTAVGVCGEVGSDVGL